MNKRFLVTGGAGYKAPTRVRLRQSGFIPVTFDNLVTGWRDAVKFGPFEQDDLLNKGDIDRFFEKHSTVAVSILQHSVRLVRACRNRISIGRIT